MSTDSRATGETMAANHDLSFRSSIPGFWYVLRWNGDKPIEWRIRYRGKDEVEAVKIFEAIACRLRRGAVILMDPRGARCTEPPGILSNLGQLEILNGRRTKTCR